MSQSALNLPEGPALDLRSIGAQATRGARRGGGRLGLRATLVFLVWLLAGCAVSLDPGSRPTSPPAQSATEVSEAAQQRFASVIQRMGSVAEAVCREERVANCNFRILVGGAPDDPPNAFQSIDERGRPILAFNLALISAVRNDDELAFVVGHEAAHHIAQHLPRQQQNAAIGAEVFGRAASAAMGNNLEAVRAAQELGAFVGARSYSKDFELEADALGTVITFRAGYDPLRGAAFFSQLADPGNHFLGTHPPNAARVETVRRVAASLRR